MNKKHWTLVAISLGKDNGLSPAQLQKVLFLLGKAYPKKLGNFYAFKPYNYGPFDKQIYQDANKLAEAGLIKLVEKNSNSWASYCIEKPGKEMAKALENTKNEPLIRYLRELVNWAQNLTFEQLISSVYEKYPEYKVNSVFRA